MTVDGITQPPSGRRRAQGRAWPWLLALVLCLAAGIGWWWRAKAPATPGATTAGASSPAASGNGGGGGGRRFGNASGVQPVSVQAVRRQDLRVTVAAIGSIAALNTATVHVQVSGVLQALNFKEGQQVRAGQTLAQIDPRSFQAAVNQAEGALARDKAQLDGARVDLARYRDLIAKDAIPRQQLDTQAALVAQLEGSVRVDQAALESARLQLAYTRVIAPISGRAGLRQLDLGNVAQPADANGIVVITQTRPITLLFAVPSVHVPRIIARLRDNEPIPVEAWDRGGKTRLAVGQVVSVDNAIDAGTDTLKVKAQFPNSDDALFPNQAVGVVLQLDTLKDMLAVPQAAVLRGAQGFYVYVVNADNSVATRVVKPGVVDGNWIGIEGALEPGERVVVDGSDRLREGARVEVIAADPNQRAGASAPAGGGRRGGRGASGAAGASWASRGAGSSGASGATGATGGWAGGGRAASAGGMAPAAGAEAGTGERPRWLDRVPPEMVDKLRAMSPEDRRAWFQQHRDELGGRGASGPK